MQDSVFEHFSYLALILQTPSSKMFQLAEPLGTHQLECLKKRRKLEIKPFVK
jgi:hypothetical protein